MSIARMEKHLKVFPRLKTALRNHLKTNGKWTGSVKIFEGFTLWLTERADSGHLLFTLVRTVCASEREWIVGWTGCKERMLSFSSSSLSDIMHLTLSNVTLSFVLLLLLLLEGNWKGYEGQGWKEGETQQVVLLC